MRLFFLLVAFLSFLYPFEYNLQRNYNFIGDGIYANDIFPNKDKIKLFDVKYNKSRFNIKSFSLIKALREHNLSINNLDKIHTVSFHRKNNFDNTTIIDSLKEKFLEKYEDIYIEDVKIKPLKTINMSNMLVKKIIIEPHALNRNKGFFKAVFDFGKKEKTIFYNFTIIAYLPGIILTKDVSREEPLSKYNVQNTRVKLSAVNKYVNKLPNYAVASRNLKKNHILTKFDIKQEYLVKKNEQLQVKLNFDGIEIISYFISLENGYINDTIKVKNISSSKIRLVKVVGKSKVLLR